MRNQGRRRGVMFDAGGVLTRPTGGRWNPRYDFESIVVSHNPQVRKDLFPQAIEAGQRFLDAGTATANRTDYHRAMLAVLGIDRLWVGLEAAFADLDIQRYFAGFAISETLGCRKPDPRMYAEGSRLLRLEPHECLFIDDDPQLVTAAKNSDNTASRSTAMRSTADDVIVSLDDLVPIIGARRTADVSK